MICSRTKLLELVTGSGIEKSPSVTAGTVAKEGEEVNKKSKLTSSKRRKVHLSVCQEEEFEIDSYTFYSTFDMDQ